MFKAVTKLFDHVEIIEKLWKWSASYWKIFPSKEDLPAKPETFYYAIYNFNFLTSDIAVLGFFLFITATITGIFSFMNNVCIQSRIFHFCEKGNLTRRILWYLMEMKAQTKGAVDFTRSVGIKQKKFDGSVSLGRTSRQKLDKDYSRQPKCRTTALSLMTLGSWLLKNCTSINRRMVLFLIHSK